MSRLDYSKWDHIEISDDEDDIHPNIDTPSLFRWRHQARVERQDEAQKEKEHFEKAYSEHQRKSLEIKQKIKEFERDKEAQDAADALAKLSMEQKELEKQEREFKKKEEDLKKKERMTPWNVDTICKEGKSKTVINKYEKKTDELTEDEKLEKQEKHRLENEKLMKKFGLMRRYEDSQEFLQAHTNLVCEETANYLVIWCINLEVEEKHDLMKHVAHQTIVMQFILELAKQLDLDARNCVKPFFARIKLAEKQYLDAFTDELESFKDRVRGRAKARMDKALAEVEEEERQKRLGPGGLDPVEVFESLPKELQDCFESKDIGLLQDVVAKMDQAQAQYHIKRCVESGLWVPGGAEEAGGEAEQPAAAEAEASSDEPSK